MTALGSNCRVRPPPGRTASSVGIGSWHIIDRCEGVSTRTCLSLSKGGTAPEGARNAKTTARKRNCQSADRLITPGGSSSATALPCRLDLENLLLTSFGTRSLRVSRVWRPWANSAVYPLHAGAPRLGGMHPVLSSTTTRHASPRPACESFQRLRPTPAPHLLQLLRSRSYRLPPHSATQSHDLTRASTRAPGLVSVSALDTVRLSIPYRPNPLDPRQHWTVGLFSHRIFHKRRPYWP